MSCHSRGRFTNKPDLEYARQLQEKFELYLLGLIFTLMALAIQTAKFGANDWADVLEIGGWLCLLVSGLAGLSRIEWVPVTFRHHSKLSELEAELTQLKVVKARGHQRIPVTDQEEPVEVSEIIARRESDVSKLEKKVGSLERSTQVKYDVHKWSFVLALVMLISARSIPPIESIVKKHLATSNVQSLGLQAGQK